MATKNTIASGSKNTSSTIKKGRGKDLKPRKQREALYVCRIARKSADGKVSYVKGFHQHTNLFYHLNKPLVSAFGAQTFAYVGHAQRVCDKLNALMKEKHKRADFFVETVEKLR